MKKETSVRWLAKQLPPVVQYYYEREISEAERMEESNIKDSMMYALDEDGHTGDWKKRFVDDYYKQLFSNS